MIAEASEVRIAHVTATFPPHYTGTGMVCYHNALGLARTGHQVTVVTAAASLGTYAYPQEIAVRRLRPLFRLGNAPLLPGLVRLERFDLVHLHYPFYFGSEMVLWRSVFAGQRYVVTYHQDAILRGVLHLAERVHHELVAKRLLARAERVMATSMDYAKASRLTWLMQKRPAAIIELPNGVDQHRFHPGVDGSVWRVRYGLPEDAQVLLFVGALDKAHYFKGMEILLEALVRLPQSGVHLVVVGDGDMRKQYQERARALGLLDRVTFTGRVPEGELPAHYALCDALVLPSTTMGEAFGLVLVEAMATGKPVIASNLPGVRSVVTDGEDGLLTRPGDVGELAHKMQALLQDPDRRREMGEKGRAKVEAKYAWESIIPGLVRVYEEALQDG